MAIELEYYAPSASLDAYIGVYYYFRTDQPATQRMCAELGNIRFVIDGKLDLIWPDGRQDAFFPASLIGPTFSAYAMQARGPAQIFGAVILPRGWTILANCNAHSVSDKICDLSEITDGTALEIHERLARAPDINQQCRLADTYFENLLEKYPAHKARYPAAIERWLLEPGDLSIPSLTEKTSLSRRQLDRVAKQYFGASPKALQRKYRTLHAMQEILRHGEYQRMFSGAPDFYDQSHFIKEFRTFIGTPPGEFESEQFELMKLGMAKRASATHKHPLLMI